MTREEATGNITHAIRWNDMPKKEALDMAIKALEQRWVPVSERLPKIGERVMVTYQREFDGETVDITTYSKHGFYIQPVIAWMPLPEPYNVESEEV